MDMSLTTSWHLNGTGSGMYLVKHYCRITIISAEGYCFAKTYRGIGEVQIIINQLQLEYLRKCKKKSCRTFCEEFESSKKGDQSLESNLQKQY